MRARNAPPNFCIGMIILTNVSLADRRAEGGEGQAGSKQVDPVLQERRRGQRFGECVCHILQSAAFAQLEHTFANHVAEEPLACIDVPAALCIRRIF